MGDHKPSLFSSKDFNLTNEKDAHSSDSDENSERGNWSNKGDYLLSMVGYVWVWATSGAFPTSPTRMEEVPVLNGRVGGAHLAIPRREEDKLQGPALRLGMFCQSWMRASPWELD